MIRPVKFTKHSLVATLISFRGSVLMVESYASQEDKYLVRHIPNFDHGALKGEYIVLDDVRFGATEWVDLEFEGKGAVRVIRFVARATLYGEPSPPPNDLLWERSMTADLTFLKTGYALRQPYDDHIFVAEKIYGEAQVSCEGVL